MIKEIKSQPQLKQHKQEKDHKRFQEDLEACWRNIY
jgi:hypothetical protein